MSPLDAKIKIMAAIRQFALEMQATWETEDQWGHIAEKLTEFLIRHGDLMDEEDVVLIMTTAALSYRQSKQSQFPTMGGDA